MPNLCLLDTFRFVIKKQGLDFQLKKTLVTFLRHLGSQYLFPRMLGISFIDYRVYSSTEKC